MVPTPDELDAYLTVLRSHEASSFTCADFAVRLAKPLAESPVQVVQMPGKIVHRADGGLVEGGPEAPEGYMRLFNGRPPQLKRKAESAG